VIRHISVVAIVLSLSASVASAQNALFTVTAQSAAVRKAPSTGSPVVGQAPRGAVLEVARDIGAWVKVAWLDAPDGFGYVHLSLGKMSQRLTMEERVAAAFVPSPTSEPVAAPESDVAAQTAIEAPASTRTIYVAAPTHVVGLGGLMSGATPGFGFTSRMWSRKRFGIQLDLSRSKLTNASSSERLRSTQFAPSLIYALPDYVGDNVWLRPYLGGGGALTRSTLGSTTPQVMATVSDSSFGFRAFGGAEVTIPGAPRFAVSADAGYQWSPQPFAGFELGGLGFSLSGHWYVK
jgi:hypothetical protein